MVSSNVMRSRPQFAPNDPYLGTLGRQPSLMINDLLPPPLQAGKGGAAAAPRLRARDYAARLGGPLRAWRGGARPRSTSYYTSVSVCIVTELITGRSHIWSSNDDWIPGSTWNTRC